MNTQILSWILAAVVVADVHAAALPMVPATAEASANTYYTDVKNPIAVNRSRPDFEVRLPANPTTGYAWFVKSYDDTLVKLTSGSYEEPKSKLIGAGGTNIWRFQLQPAAFAQKKPVTIKLLYTRPWEKNAGKETTITVNPIE